MKVHFVAVSYRSAESALALARRFVKGAANCPGQVFLTIVDNSDVSEGEALSAAVQELGGPVRVLTSRENSGYFGGARRGSSNAPPDFAFPDWLVISNVDIQFEVSSWLQGLREVDVSIVGVVAPRVVSKVTQRELNPYLLSRPSALRMKLYTIVWGSYLLASIYSMAAEFASHFGLLRIEKSRKPADRAPGARIYAAHGSIFALSSRCFDSGRALDHGAFLYGEEITVAEYARSMGLSVIYRPEIEVVHDEHESTSAVPNRQRWRFVHQGALYCYDRYFRSRTGS